MIRALKRLKNGSIRIQLIIYSIGISVAIGIISFFYLQGNSRFLNSYNYYIRHISSINSLINYQEENASLLANFLNVVTEEDVNEYEFNTRVIYELIDIIEEVATTQEVKLRLRALPFLEKKFEKQTMVWIENKDNLEYNHYDKYLEIIEIHNSINDYLQEILALSIDENKNFLNEMSDTLGSMKKFFALTVLIITAFNLIFYTTYTNYLTKPIDMLIKRVKKIGKGVWEKENNDFVGPTEIRDLSMMIENMAKDIKNLTQDVKDKAQLEIKLAEEEVERVKTNEMLIKSKMQSIQMQINPHFLFNTLNVISRMAMIENADKVSELIIALSKHMRYSLRNTTNCSSLSEEIDMISQYLYILKSRMGDRLSTKIDFEKELANIQIPGYTIQPIVENAFMHGIEDKIENGLIRVTIKMRRGALYLRISDNGKGMTKDQLQFIREQTKKSSKDNIGEEHIGIANVCYRLNATFGVDVTFIITSKKGKGTIFTIKIQEKAVSVEC